MQFSLVQEQFSRPTKSRDKKFESDVSRNHAFVPLFCDECDT